MASIRTVYWGDHERIDYPNKENCVFKPLFSGLDDVSSAIFPSVDFAN